MNSFDVFVIKGFTVECIGQCYEAPRKPSIKKLQLDFYDQNCWLRIPMKIEVCSLSGYYLCF